MECILNITTGKQFVMKKDLESTSSFFTHESLTMSSRNSDTNNLPANIEERFTRLLNVTDQYDEYKMFSSNLSGLEYNRFSQTNFSESSNYFSNDDDDEI